jgi:hypothetical protein
MSARLNQRKQSYRVPPTPPGFCERCQIETDPEIRVRRRATYASGSSRVLTFCDDRCAAIFAAGAEAIREIPFDALSTYGEPWHGTVSGYVYHGCRCDWCSEARADDRAAAAKRAKAAA